MAVFFMVLEMGDARGHQLAPADHCRMILHYLLVWRTRLVHCSDSRHICSSKMPCVVGEIDLNKKDAKFWAALLLLLGLLQGFYLGLRFPMLPSTPTNEFSSPPVSFFFPPGCPNHEWPLPYFPGGTADDPHRGLRTYLFERVVPSLGRHYGKL